MPPRLAQDLPTSRTVGAHIHALRTARGWSLRALGRHTGPPASRSATPPSAASKQPRPHQPAVAVIVDDLVTLAAVFGVQPEQLLTAPGCFVCMDKPPTGFTCRTCGAEA
jgi:hypothetical protein